jgi:sarcosine oxidase gamma subunit
MVPVTILRVDAGYDLYVVRSFARSVADWILGTVSA